MLILADENLHADIVLGLRRDNYESITKVLDREEETFRTKKSVVIVLSEAGSRLHKPENGLDYKRLSRS